MTTKKATEIQYKRLSTGVLYTHVKSNGRYIYMAQKETGERVKIYWPSDLYGKNPTYLKISA